MRMNRFWRINTIWRKELIDTLRDRRTVIAMVLVPLVLYPALMIGSLQALEVQVSYLVRERYDVAVENEDAQRWLRRVLDTDAARHAAPGGFTAEDLVQKAEERPTSQPKETLRDERRKGANAARVGVRTHPPEYRIFVEPDASAAVRSRRVHAGLRLEGPIPAANAAESLPVTVLYDQSEIRSEIAATGVQGVLERYKSDLLQRRLSQHQLTPDFIEPLRIGEQNLASPQQMAGSALGQVVPLILIIMTLTGAIYPAIDLTAGERERGTLETLMVAPVPTIDLITGKFIVVTMIAMLSAVLNLASVGGTVWLGGVGELLTGGKDFSFPFQSLPWILLLLIPLAVMFSALLLAVCSFARSFKEAQNYVMPVMIAVLIPGVVGVLPGTRLEGPILIMPVANIVVLTRDLFLGHFQGEAIFWVVLSTCLYAGAAVAVAAKLFGQEAVLFADSGSIKTIFQRKFFKPQKMPSAASALLVMAFVYSLNFYLQNAIGKSSFSHGMSFFVAITLTLVLLLGFGPIFAARYMRVDVHSALKLRPPPAAAMVAALLFGASTWILAMRWMVIQKSFLPVSPEVQEAMSEALGWMDKVNPLTLVFFLALVPALCEELFFRGYALSGLTKSLGRIWAVLVVAIAFGLFHVSAQRMLITTGLGVLLGLLAIQFRSIWAPMLAHFMHNAISILRGHDEGLGPWLKGIGFNPVDGNPPDVWVWGALAAVAVGILICLFAARREESIEPGSEHRSFSGAAA